MVPSGHGFADAGADGLHHSYESLILSASEAVSHIRPGQRVFLGTACGQPPALVNALLEQAGRLEGIEIIHLDFA